MDIDGQLTDDIYEGLMEVIKKRNIDDIMECYMASLMFAASMLQIIKEHEGALVHRAAQKLWMQSLYYDGGVMERVIN